MRRFVDFFLTVFLIPGVCLGLYFPAEKLTLTLRQDNPEDILTRLELLRYSGDRAAPAVYSVSTEAAGYLHVEQNGNLRWIVPRTDRRNVSAIIEAKFMAYTASMELRIVILPAITDPCKATVQERCFGGMETSDYKVYAESQFPVQLLNLTASRIPCRDDSGRNYTLHGGEDGVATLTNKTLLTVDPRHAGGEFQLTLVCQLGRGLQSKRKLKVNLIPGRVKLPVYPRPGVTHRLIPRIVKNEEVLLSWLVTSRSSQVRFANNLTAASSLSSSAPLYRLSLEPRNFTADLINATLFLIKLTWTKNSSESYVKIPIRILLCDNGQNYYSNCPKTIAACGKFRSNCTIELWTEVSVLASLPRLNYTRGKLSITPSPFARISQAFNSINFSSSSSPTRPPTVAPPSEENKQEGLKKEIKFKSALPEVLESGYNVTGSQGIVYLQHWAVQILEQLRSQPGMLVEWSLGGTSSGGGLVWLEISLQPSDCKEWDMCSEARTEKACRRPCRLGASPLRKGLCEWRNITSQSMKSSTPPSRHYFTCSPGLEFCPDQVCDPLERLYPGLCFQDCTTHAPTLGILDSSDKEGIQRGVGVCSCDNTGKCHCGRTPTGAELPRSNSSAAYRGSGQDQPLPPPKLTAAQQGGLDKEERCNTQCIGLIVILATAGTVTTVSIVYLSASRGCHLQKKCTENSSSGGGEYSGHALLPLGTAEIRTPTAPDVSATTLTTFLNQVEVDPKWELPRSRLKVEECLGEGEFGRVLRATARDLPNRPGYSTVAVKTLKENAGQSELEDLLSEYGLLKEVTHPNVVRLLGACTSPGGPIYLIIEFCALGSLRGYLRRHRNIKSRHDGASEVELKKDGKITPHDILSFAWQIAKGMAYLTEIKLVHRDLAARNILLATGKVCKISDFGLTRDVYEDDTYLKKSRGRVPVKWMALESLSDHVYTSKSDVWSFGIVLWELVTLGGSPYPGLAIQNLYHLLRSGYRMQRPLNCSLALYDIMKECWSADPADRPTFAELVDRFERMLQDGSDYLDCNLLCVSNPTYFAEGLPNGNVRPSGANEMDITFQMDLEDSDPGGEEDLPPPPVKYENATVNKDTSYDIPKPVVVSSIVMSDLLARESQR